MTCLIDLNNPKYFIYSFLVPLRNTDWKNPMVSPYLWLSEMWKCGFFRSQKHRDAGVSTEHLTTAFINISGLDVQMLYSIMLLFTMCLSELWLPVWTFWTLSSVSAFFKSRGRHSAMKSASAWRKTRTNDSQGNKLGLGHKDKRDDGHPMRQEVMGQDSTRVKPWSSTESNLW